MQSKYLLLDISQRIVASCTLRAKQSAMNLQQMHRVQLMMTLETGRADKFGFTYLTHETLSSSLNTKEIFLQKLG